MWPVCPPHLELSNDAFRWPILCLVRQEKDVDEAPHLKPDVYEHADRPWPGNEDDGALEHLPKAQLGTDSAPLDITDHITSSHCACAREEGLNVKLRARRESTCCFPWASSFTWYAHT